VAKKNGIEIFTRSQITKYELTGDKKGLLAYFGNGKSYYHIHSDELTVLEKWIRSLLLKLEISKIKSLGKRKR